MRNRSLAVLGALALVASMIAACGGESFYQPSQEEIDLRNEGAADLASGKADTGGCSGTVLPDRGDFGFKIALTFDDGPSQTTTPQVLDTLAAHGAPATFFVNGKNLRTEAHKAIVRRMVAEGHLVGNHSQNHQNLRNLSPVDLKTEVEQTHWALQALGVDPTFFRFPWGAASCDAAATVRSYGYNVTGWHVDSADWCFAASPAGECPASTFEHVDDGYRSDMSGFVLLQARARAGGVLLMHDIHPYTVASLDSILTRLEAAGFSFVRLDDASVFPLLNGESNAGPWIGTSCAGNNDCLFTVEGEGGFCHDFVVPETQTAAGFCSLFCEGYCPDRADMAPTFCVSLDGGVTGMCVPKADAMNNGCLGVSGTVQQVAERFIGTSSAPASLANVCLPQQ